MDVVGYGLMINPSLGIEGLVVIYSIVELRPYADHEATSHHVHLVEHLLWIRIA